MNDLAFTIMGWFALLAHLLLIYAAWYPQVYKGKQGRKKRFAQLFWFIPMSLTGWFALVGLSDGVILPRIGQMGFNILREPSQVLFACVVLVWTAYLMGLKEPQQAN